MAVSAAACARMAACMESLDQTSRSPMTLGVCPHICPYPAERTAQ